MPRPSDFVDRRSSSRQRWFQVIVSIATFSGAIAVLALVSHLAPEPAGETGCGPGGPESIPYGPRTSEWLNQNNPARQGAMRGADYQRSFVLPGGCVLWVFQDAYVATSDGRNAFVHNAGTLQRPDGTMSTLISGNRERPRSWLLAERGEADGRWYWALDGVLRDDRTFQLLVAEMSQHGSGDRLSATVQPTGVWVVSIDVSTAEVRAARRAPNNMHGKDVYGWSVTSDGEWTYLYSHCYRQFGHPPWGHDLSCSADVKVARLPHGQLAPEAEQWQFWDGDAWQSDPSRAVPVIPTGGDRDVNPTDVMHVDGRFYAVTKEGDWHGSHVYFDVADAPQGPFETVRRRPAEPPKSRHGNPTNTYYASWTPWLTVEGRPIYGLSSNTWNPPRDLVNVYNPTFFEAPLRVTQDR